MLPIYPRKDRKTSENAKKWWCERFLSSTLTSDAIYPLRQRAACSTANIQPFYSFAVSLVVWHAPHLLGSCVFAEDAFVIAFAIAMCDELLTFLFPGG